MNENSGGEAERRSGGDAQRQAIVMFGDVVGSRRDPGASSTWLRLLCGELEEVYGRDRLASFGFTQGDELQGLLAPGADPLQAVLMAGLHDEPRRMRWAVAAGAIEPGTGPATERTGEAFLRARDAIEEARRRRDGLRIVTGDRRADVLLDDLAPLLAEMLDGLSRRQRVVARLMVVDQLRQAEVAEGLRISRASVSVTAGRAHVRSIERIVRAIRTLFAEGSAEVATS